MYDPIYDSLQDELAAAHRGELIEEARDVADKLMQFAPRMGWLAGDEGHDWAFKFFRRLWQHRGWEAEGMVDIALEQFLDSGGVVGWEECFDEPAVLKGRAA